LDFFLGNSDSPTSGPDNLYNSSMKIGQLTQGENYGANSLGTATIVMNTEFNRLKM